MITAQELISPMDLQRPFFLTTGNGQNPENIDTPTKPNEDSSDEEEAILDEELAKRMGEYNKEEIDEGQSEPEEDRPEESDEADEDGEEEEEREEPTEENSNTDSEPNKENGEFDQLSQFIENNPNLTEVADEQADAEPVEKAPAQPTPPPAPRVSTQDYMRTDFRTLSDEVIKDLVNRIKRINPECIPTVEDACNALPPSMVLSQLKFDKVLSQDGLKDLDFHVTINNYIIEETQGTRYTVNEFLEQVIKLDKNARLVLVEKIVVGNRLTDFKERLTKQLWLTQNAIYKRCFKKACEENIMPHGLIAHLKIIKKINVDNFQIIDDKAGLKKSYFYDKQTGISYHSIEDFLRKGVRLTTNEINEVCKDLFEHGCGRYIIDDEGRKVIPVNNLEPTDYFDYTFQLNFKNIIKHTAINERVLYILKNQIELTWEDIAKAQGISNSLFKHYTGINFGELKKDDSNKEGKYTILGHSVKKDEATFPFFRQIVAGIDWALFAKKLRFDPKLEERVGLGDFFSNEDFFTEDETEEYLEILSNRID